MLHLFNIIYHTYMTDIYSVFNYTSHHRNFIAQTIYRNYRKKYKDIKYHKIRVKKQ